MGNVINLQPKGMTNLEFKEYNRKQRVGQTNMNSDGTLMKITEYINANKITVEFQDELQYKVNASYHDFKIGNIKNPGKRVIHGIGYIGVGPYLTSHKISGKKVPTKAYDAWRRMLDRCYGVQYTSQYPTYKDSTVCDEWQNFQIFAKWFYNNYYDTPNQSIEVDKDWLCVGNKVYCPEKCCLAPSIINTCLITHKKLKNFNLPIGVSPTESGRYKARCNEYGKRKDLGIYNTPQEAESIYWNFKIKYVESLAKEYKAFIPTNLYNSMMNFKSTYVQRYNLSQMYEVV